MFKTHGDHPTRARIVATYKKAVKFVCAPMMFGAELVIVPEVGAWNPKLTLKNKPRTRRGLSLLLQQLR
jgi:hypothetical protein